MSDNPIVKRQKQLTQHWLDFTARPEARLCRWLVTPDEMNMLKAFYLLQDSEGNDTGDFFMNLSYPFNQPDKYARELLSEFHDQVAQMQEEVDDPALQRWKPLPDVPGTSPILHFLSTLGNFAQCLDLADGYVVIYLQPQVIQNPHAWSDWLLQLMQLGIPRGVRCMLTDDRLDPALDLLAEYFPKEIISITPDLKMGAAVNELAAAGDPANPGVQFRKAFVKLTQAVGKQDLTMVEITARKALRIADANNWPHMKVAVNMAKGGAYLGKQNFQQAYQIYGEAFQVASKAYAEGDKPSGKLSVTSLFSQGAAMVGAGKYDVAVRSYTQAVPYAEEAEDYYNLMEAWRMAGYCYQQIGEDEPAWDALWHAMEAGAKLDENIRPDSTLPYVGKELLTLTHKSGQIDLYHHIQDRMDLLVGDGWNQKVSAT